MGNDIIQTICTIGMKRTRSDNTGAPQKRRKTDFWRKGITFLDGLYNAFILASKTTTLKANVPTSKTTRKQTDVQIMKELHTLGFLQNITPTNEPINSVKGICLGKGVSGMVFVHKKDPTKAVKVFIPQTGQPQTGLPFWVAALKEGILVSRALGCEVTVNYRECWITMPRFSGKELFDVIVERKDNPFDESELHTLGTQILEQLVELHQLGIVHRDIKPENIMYNKDDGTFQLIDFGFAYCQPFENTVFRSMGWNVQCGTFIPPEMIKNWQSSWATDIWCTAIMMIVAATANNVPNIQSQDDVSTVLSKLSHNLSPGMVDVLRQMLEQDPKKRPTAKQALQMWTDVTP